MKTAALLLLVVASLSGYAAADEPDATAIGNALTKAGSMLAERSDPDSLAAAALLAQVTDPARAEQLAGRASAAAPKRPDLLWLHGQLCRDVPGCNRKPIDARLRALDPQNGAVYLPALQDAGRDKDEAEANRLLAALAGSRRIDFYWNPLIAHLGRAVIATKTLAPGPSMVAVTGVAASIVIPAVSGTSLPCRDWIVGEDRRAQCKAIARAFLQGDTVVAESAGQSMTQALWAPESPEASAAQDAKRVLLYQILTNGAEAGRRLSDEAAVHRFLDKLDRYRRERDLLVAELTEAGRSPSPPADWQPGPPPKEALAPATR